MPRGGGSGSCRCPHGATYSDAFGCDPVRHGGPEPSGPQEGSANMDEGFPRRGLTQVGVTAGATGFRILEANLWPLLGHSPGSAPFTSQSHLPVNGGEWCPSQGPCGGWWTAAGPGPYCELCNFLGDPWIGRQVLVPSCPGGQVTCPSGPCSSPSPLNGTSFWLK